MMGWGLIFTLKLLGRSRPPKLSYFKILDIDLCSKEIPGVGVVHHAVYYHVRHMHALWAQLPGSGLDHSPLGHLETYRILRIRQGSYIVCEKLSVNRKCLNSRANLCNNNKTQYYRLRLYDSDLNALIAL